MLASQVSQEYMDMDHTSYNQFNCYVRCNNNALAISYLICEIISAIV